MNEEYTSTTTLTEQTVENERDARTEELQNTFSYDGYQVVRKELFAHLRDPAIVIRKDSITFNTACITGLGCINDYVENQHFNTIIVANEKAIREQEANKLESDKIAIGYAEIKEKVVERQLAFQSEVPVKQDELRSNPTS